MSAYRVAPALDGDSIDRLLYDMEALLARHLSAHFDATVPSCGCHDCEAFVGVVEARVQRRERLAPDAARCARCATTVAQRDVVVSSRDFGVALCPRDYAWATRERVAGRRPVLAERLTGVAL